MNNSLIPSPAKFQSGQIIHSVQLTGPEQMALDLMLLDQSITQKEFSMTARFYTWLGDWISIGKNQTNIPKRWLKLAEERKIGIVKRPTGGSAVLHSGGLTYSLIWDSPPKSRKEAYLKANQWIVDGFNQLGIKLRFGDQPINTSLNNCFASSTMADLVNEDGQKCVGSAQFWKKGHLLQHGEILLRPTQSLWLDVFNTNPPKRKGNCFDISKLELTLKKSLISSWPEINWKNYKLGDEMLQQIKHNSKAYIFLIN